MRGAFPVEEQGGSWFLLSSKAVAQGIWTAAFRGGIPPFEPTAETTASFVFFSMFFQVPFVDCLEDSLSSPLKRLLALSFSPWILDDKGEVRARWYQLHCLFWSCSIVLLRLAFAQSDVVFAVGQDHLTNPCAKFNSSYDASKERAIIARRSLRR